MTTRKSGKSKASKPRVKVVDMETGAQKETGASDEGKNNPKGGGPVARYHIENAWPSKWKG